MHSQHPALPFGVTIEIWTVEEERNRQWKIKQGTKRRVTA
jgi:hypothetical protein